MWVAGGVEAETPWLGVLGSPICRLRGRVGDSSEERQLGGEKGKLS